MVTKEYIARETLKIEDSYPSQHWMFIWNGEVVRVDINKDTRKILTTFEDTMPAEEVFFIKKFVNETLEELHGKTDSENRD